jgi:hypothetical protein
MALTLNQIVGKTIENLEFSGLTATQSLKIHML